MESASRFPEPTRDDVIGNLVDHISLAEDDLGWLTDDAEVWPSAGTLLPDTTTVCPVPVLDGQGEPTGRYVTKTFESVDWVGAHLFAAYLGIECKIVGGGVEPLLPSARDAFARRESYLLERQLVGSMMVAHGDLWDAATDITPASGAVPLKTALALLEEDARAAYGPRAIIHMAPAAASLLGDVLVKDDDRLYTSLGTPVAAGGGYRLRQNGPSGAEPAVGETWLYATGAISAVRGRQIEQDGFDTTSNDQRFLFERRFGLAIDGYRAAIRAVI